ncbi:SET and MYND domain-containing protein 4 [Bicyclus anynana]|uniref:SET and MYND domain-containing protein 4 n=1 Tax=Bicyclus anynana TaxID=110368 RepID=A0ABM3LWH5_BICAN|nr:SET and MYND domain-containing protein 4 [Bicyclus anynana]
MFETLQYLQELVKKSGTDDKIYDGMAKDDLSEMVMPVLNIYKYTIALPATLEFIHKSDSKSTSFRNLGNDFYKRGYYQKALASYNQALLYASKNSTEMKLGYSNRSALFSTLQLGSACINDIEKVFAMGCPIEIKEKLIKRRMEALPLLFDEELHKKIKSGVSRDIADPNATKYNSLIPCVNSDVNIDSSTDKPKVVASANMKVGSVVGSETAYVSLTSSPNNFVSCHFCQKKALNLIPCEGCCCALFCDEECKKKCMEEYHEDECKIIDAIEDGCLPTINVAIAVKACFKLRRSCKSWNEFITASKNMGSDRIKSSSFKEIYGTNKYSILSINDDRVFVHGTLYNSCFLCAIVLYCLDLTPSYLPKDTVEREQSIKALARVIMFIATYQKVFPIIQNEHNLKLDESYYAEIKNNGLYPFIAKLKHSCSSNLMLATNNNRLVMIAIRPIKKGDELTVPFLWPRLDAPIPKWILNKNSFVNYGTVCGCTRCANDSEDIKNNDQLSEYQREFISQRVDHKNYTHAEISKILAVLDNVRDSKVYNIFYQYFRTNISVFELFNGGNIVLDNSFDRK